MICIIHIHLEIFLNQCQWQSAHMNPSQSPSNSCLCSRSSSWESPVVSPKVIFQIRWQIMTSKFGEQKLLQKNLENLMPWLSQLAMTFTTTSCPTITWKQNFTVPHYPGVLIIYHFLSNRFQLFRILTVKFGRIPRLRLFFFDVQK